MIPQRSKESYEICVDCRQNVFEMGEAFYKVKKDVWPLAGGEKGVLCIGCLEARIGRELTPEDFPDNHINRKRSDRLRARKDS